MNTTNEIEQKKGIWIEQNKRDDKIVTGALFIVFNLVYKKTTTTKKETSEVKGFYESAKSME